MINSEQININKDVLYSTLVNFIYVIIKLARTHTAGSSVLYASCKIKSKSLSTESGQTPRT